MNDEHQGKDPWGDLLDHEYDGIREYDNPCPGWWKWLFFATFVFAPFYFFYFHMGKAGISVAKDHENAVADNIKLRFSEIGELTLDEPTMLQYMRDPAKAEWLSVGQSTYEQRCKSCHADGGRGSVGPNLTDEYFKNIKSLTDVITVISQGAGNGSMPAWKQKMHPNELLLVSAYVANLRGQNLPGGKAPEGQEIPPWPPLGEATTTDETTTDPQAGGAPGGDDLPETGRRRVTPRPGRQSLRRQQPSPRKTDGPGC